MATTTNLMGNEWDDTELVKAYNKAVKSWRKPKSPGKEVEGQNNESSPAPGPWVTVEDKAKTSSAVPSIVVDNKHANQEESVKLAVGNWIVGSPCRSIYSQDGLEYEAKVVGIEGPRCTIRFVGFGNQEMKELDELRNTFGKRSRDRQRRDAHLANCAVNPDLGLEDYYSSVSLTSSMFNNCPEREDDVQTTTTETSGFPPFLSSSPVAAGDRGTKGRKKGATACIASGGGSKSPGKRKREIGIDLNDSVPVQGDEIDIDIEDNRTDDILPSGAEATVGSLSSSSDSSGGEEADGDDEATSGPSGRMGLGFPKMLPRFPIPPMPLSIAGADGKFDFGRGQLPSLLLSWYMSGYHAGYFDARQEYCTNATMKGSPRGPEEGKNRSKRH